MKRLAVILLLIGMLCFTSSCTSATDYNHLLTKYNNLVNDYNELHTKCNKLVNDFNELNTKDNELADKYDDLVGKYNELATQFEGATIPPYLTTKGREVNLVFRNIDGNLESWNWKVEALEVSIIQGQFMREVDISDLNYLRLYDIANKFSKGSKYVQLSSQGSYLDFRPYIMANTFEPIALKFFSRHSDDESKVREVWNMVTQLNTYCKDVTETPRLPLETLLLGGGDCEDLAILTASMLKAMPAEWKVSLVYMDSDNPTSMNKVNHVTVHVDTGEYKTFVESTRGNIMCPWEEVDGYYFEIR